MRFVRNALAALLFAFLGALAGRMVAQVRRQQAAGLAPAPDFEAARPGPKELMPGLIAALRVRDRPWSFLHLPSWLAAFAVNFAFAAFGNELDPVLRLFGVERADEDDSVLDPDAPTQWRAARGEFWTVETSPDAEPVTPPPPPPAPAPGDDPSRAFRPFGA